MNIRKNYQWILCVLALVMLLTSSVSADYAKSVVISDGSTTMKSSDVVEITIGNSKTFTATMTPAGAEPLIWRSSAPTIASVSNGKVTAKAIGTVTITARSKSNSASATFRVKVVGPKVSSITVSAASSTLRDSKSLQMSAKVSPTNAQTKNVTWSVKCQTPSDCPAGVPAVISNTGKLTAKHVNKKTVVIVTAKAADGSGVTGNKAITLYPRAIGLHILDKNAIITIPIWGSEDHFHTKDVTDREVPIIKDLSTTDKYIELSAVIDTASYSSVTKNVTWSSSNKNIADVDSTGRITFYKPGTVTITCRTTDGSKLKATVTVTGRILAQDVIITSPNGRTTLAAGKSMQLKARVVPANATIKKVTWSSSDTVHAATVDQNGKVTAKNVKEPITVTITASVTGVDSRNNPVGKGTFAITIYPAVSSVRILNASSKDVTGKTLGFNKSTKSTQLSVLTNPASASSEVTWKSSNEKVAKVDSEIDCIY